jgi:hypothetical protein
MPGKLWGDVTVPIMGEGCERYLARRRLRQAQSAANRNPRERRIGPTATRGASVSSERLSVARRNDCGCFNHKNYCALRGTRAMNDALRDNEALVSRKLDAFILEIDD